MNILRYFGPKSPWGPISAGFMIWIAGVFLVASLGPPLIWLARTVFGWWWALWLI